MLHLATINRGHVVHDEQSPGYMPPQTKKLWSDEQVLRRAAMPLKIDAYVSQDERRLAVDPSLDSAQIVIMEMPLTLPLFEQLQRVAADHGMEPEEVVHQLLFRAGFAVPLVWLVDESEKGPVHQQLERIRGQWGHRPMFTKTGGEGAN